MEVVVVRHPRAFCRTPSFGHCHAGGTYLLDDEDPTVRLVMRVSDLKYVVRGLWMAGTTLESWLSFGPSVLVRAKAVVVLGPPVVLPPPLGRTTGPLPSYFDGSFAGSCLYGSHGSNTTVARCCIQHAIVEHDRETVRGCKGPDSLVPRLRLYKIP